MRYLCLIAALTLVTPTAALAQINPTEWNTEGLKTNPVANTTLCQYINTTQVDGESKTFHIVLASSVTAIPVLEHIGADGTTVITSGGSGPRAQSFAIGAFSIFELMKQVVTLAFNERVRMRTGVLLVGSVQCSLFIDS